MTDNAPVTEHANDLLITRLIPASAHTLFRCWTEPELLKQWFVPRPWTIARAEMDVRPGGQSLVVMRDPDGNEYPNLGTYLEVVADQRLVFTDAYGPGWTPADKPFMTAIISFEPEDGQTRYTAMARHWTEEARQQHIAMGFEQGWNICADQLQALAATLG
ncbi:MAG: SRPBCC family protein [Comamonas sp.]|nr:SRPBCC family protein [Comamonas sp.]